MHSLKIVHKNTSKSCDPNSRQLTSSEELCLNAFLEIANPSSVATWKTCLREIHFLPASLSESDAIKMGALSENEALTFLIEVLCGLHSPLLGENEVFGQFKQFAEEQKKQGHPLFQDHQKWIPFVYQEVKRLRSEHIRHWGSNSYGSLLRKQLENEDGISVFGTGQLTEEILPWLSHKQKLQVIGRNQERLDFFGTKYPHFNLLNSQHNRSNPSFLFQKTLIISATLTNQQVVQLLDLYGANIHCIYDLRGLSSPNEEQELKTLLIARSEEKSLSEVRIVFLNHLFQMIQEQREQTKHLVSLVKQEIQDKVQNYLLRSEHRPLGWDDLCA